MPRLAADQWAEIRQRREMGESFGSLAQAFGISDVAILKRARKEGWGDGTDVGAAVRRKVSEKVSGVVSGANSAEKAVAIDQAAEQGARIIARQQQDWETYRTHFGVVTADWDAARHAKINAESLKILHEGERASYGLDDPNSNRPAELVIHVKREPQPW